MPLRRNAYHRFRVAAVVAESDDVVSVHVTGRHLDKLPARGGPVLHLAVPRAQPLVAGQPVLAVGGARRPHAAPDRQGGRQRQRRAAAPPGRDPRVRRGTVRGVHLAAPHPARHAADRRRSGDHAGSGPAGGGTGRRRRRALPGAQRGRRRAARRGTNSGRGAAAGSCTCSPAARARATRRRPFEPENLRALVPDIMERDVYVCGPPAMTSAVLKSLRSCRFPRCRCTPSGSAWPDAPGSDGRTRRSLRGLRSKSVRTRRAGLRSRCRATSGRASRRTGSSARCRSGRSR